MKTVAIMQPYLYPYAGYFRLAALADHFVIFDCVQFPRRGRVHRCELPSLCQGTDRGENSSPSWLALPFAKSPQATLIRDMVFRQNAHTIWKDRLAILDQTIPNLTTRKKDSLAQAVYDHLHGPLRQPIDFLEAGLKIIIEGLELKTTISRSSSLDIPGKFRNEQRVLEIVKKIGADRYINAPNGVELYNSFNFAEEKIKLQFLQAYTGAFFYLLPAILQNNASQLKADIVSQSILIDTPKQA